MGGGNDTREIATDDSAFGGSDDDWFLLDVASLTGGEALVDDFQGRQFGEGAGDRDRFMFGTGSESGSFDYRGDAAFSGSGDSEARYPGNGRLAIDVDGDGSREFPVTVSGLTANQQFTASDLLWL